MAAVVTGSVARYFVPEVTIESAPVKAGVGELPMSEPAVPVNVVEPVFVIPDPARTAKLDVEPRFTAGSAADALAPITAAAAKTATVAMVPRAKNLFLLLGVKVVILPSPKWTPI